MHVIPKRTHDFPFIKLISTNNNRSAILVKIALFLRYDIQ
ncbi:Hypothetical protein HPV225_0827 [Helicobacter pylori v225d]|nr:Hypothetical protein HPV225_0827 [Helicobacter pylori v225d]